MSLLAPLRSLARALLRRRELEAELDDELRYHLASRADDLERQGVPRSEAERRARLEFGSLDGYKERYREARGLRWVDELRQDLLFTQRSLRRSPGFTTVAVATLALGIGANSLLFTVVEAVLLRPLPYREPERLVMVYSVGSFGPHRWNDGPLMEPDHLALRELAAFSGVAAFSSSEITLARAGEPVRLASATVTASLFALLEAKPILGRSFATEERNAAVLSEALWRGRFRADERAIGQAVNIEGVSHTIVGVMPGRFNFPPKAQLWTPLQLRPDYRSNAFHKAVARLAPGVTREQALAQTETLLRNFDKRERRLRVVDLRESMVGGVRTLLLVLLAAVLCVLLIGCANLANLLLARAATRGPEMFVRASLGAGRGRLVRQLLTESTVLALAGGAAGLALAYAGLPAFLRLAPSDTLPRGEEIQLNGTVLAFTLALSVATGLLFGLAPALFTLRKHGPEARLRAAASSARGEKRLHGALVVAETALVLVLLIGAGLLAKSLWRLQNVDPGFRRGGLITMSVWLPDRNYPSAAAKRAFHTRLLERLHAVRELDGPSAVNLLPFGSALWRGDFVVEGREYKPLDLIVGKPAVSAGYFRTLGIPLLRGRYFDERDQEGALSVAIVSDSVARHCWPGEDPLGKRLTMDDPKLAPWLTVVGVVGDVRQDSLAAGAQPIIYVPLQQEWRGFFLGPMAFVARTSTDPSAAAAALRAQLRALDPELPAQRIETLERLLADSLAPPRFRTAMLVAFGSLALALALVGVYGVMAYEVTRRTAEIGVRRALGAGTRDVLGLILGRTAALVSAGLALGLLAAAGAARTLESFLFGVPPLDVATFATVSLALFATAFFAAAVPAHRAARVDPARVLRCE